MKQYINKNDIAVEIENRIKETESMQPKFDQFWAGQISAFKGILKILDTLETKEVDLEKELGKYLDANDIEFIHQIKLLDFAKYFFELGLKTNKGE